jgi:hypothetical protein
VQIDEDDLLRRLLSGNFVGREGGSRMPKDSQPDNKRTRIKKAHGNTPITRENQNHNKNAKRQSMKHNDV